jgi:hypothetical protein
MEVLLLATSRSIAERLFMHGCDLISWPGPKPLTIKLLEIRRTLASGLG